MNLFFENRQLKALITEQDDKIEQLESIIDDLEAEKAALKVEMDEKIEKLKNDVRHYRTELGETKEMVRKQSAADMLLTALRALGAVKDDRPQPIDYQRELAMYQQRYNSLSQGQSNFLDGLGLGALGGSIMGQSRP